MKNLLPFALLCLLAPVVNAQFETGKKLIHAQLNGGLSKKRIDGNNFFDQQNHFINTSFSFLKFKTPTSLRGFGFRYGYGYDSYTPGTSGASKISSYQQIVGVFVNKTKLQPLAKKLYLNFTGSLGGNYRSGKFNQVSITNYSTSKGYSIDVTSGMGLWYQLNQRFIVTGGLSNLFNLSLSRSYETVYSGFNITKTKSNGVFISSGLNDFYFNSFTFGLLYQLK